MMRIFPALFILFVLSSCNTDLYFGYQDKAQELHSTTEISGRITNFYTKAPMFALVQFGTQETRSDANGFYHFSYLLNEDELRNKPVRINIIADNCYPFETEKLLEPISNTFDFELLYAAPIIEKTAIFVDSLHGDLQLIVQAIITDYQGISTLENTEISFISDNQITATYQLPLLYLQIYQRGYFQVGFKNAAAPNHHYKIFTRDTEGYEDSLEHGVDPRHFDVPLFDPQM